MNVGVLVVGSSNTDMVIKTSRLPGPGETILGGEFFMTPGGKGANQAVAASRLGGAVTFICKTGNDIFGRQAKDLFNKEGIDTSCILEDRDHPSGVALITVDDNGENCIVVAPGSNGFLSAGDILKAKHYFEKAEIILMQLEIPLDTVVQAAAIGASLGKKIILNPAPVCALPDELLAKVSVITPNETEAEMLTGIKIIDEVSAEAAARKLQSKGVATVIITLGAKGALLLDGNICEFIKSPTVKAIDTTAAGDVFSGALVAALSKKKTMTEAVKFACIAASISVTRLGAQASAPYLFELID